MHTRRQEAVHHGLRRGGKQPKGDPRASARTGAAEHMFDDEMSRSALPPYIHKLIKPYKLEAYGYEIVECARKMALVGIPVFFYAGLLEQLVLGLLVSAVSICVLLSCAPYEDETDNIVAVGSQIVIFFSLLSGILLKTDLTYSAKGSLLEALLCTLGLLPAILAILFETPFATAIASAPRRAVTFLMGTLGSRFGTPLRQIADCAGSVGGPSAKPTDARVEGEDTDDDLGDAPDELKPSLLNVGLSQQRSQEGDSGGTSHPEEVPIREVPPSAPQHRVSHHGCESHLQPPSPLQQQVVAQPNCRLVALGQSTATSLPTSLLQETSYVPEGAVVPGAVAPATPPAISGNASASMVADALGGISRRLSTMAQSLSLGVGEEHESDDPPPSHLEEDHLSA
jgi:hypothetical protein